MFVEPFLEQVKLTYNLQNDQNDTVDVCSKVDIEDHIDLDFSSL